MSSRIDKSYSISVGKIGRTVRVEVKKRYDVSAELKRKASKQVHIRRKGAI